MKKTLVILTCALFLITIAGFALAEEDREIPAAYLSGESGNNETDSHLLGASCGTVAPGYQNECCVNKGYSGWDEEEFKCIGEEDEENNEEGALGAYANGEHENEENQSEENENECEPWNCTQWSDCVNGTKIRECVKSQLNCTEDTENELNDTEEEQPRLTKSCHEKEELKHYERTIDCPEECVCSGSTIKCLFENGTREMTVYAGKSGNVIVQIKNINMSTNVTLYKNEEGKIYGNFRGNITHEVKLPDEIKERLQNHTRTRLYNESINLTEDGYYHIQGHKKSRLFWIVPVREHVRAEVNAETGETIKIRNSWWGFMARDERDDDNNDNSNETQ